MHAQVTQVCGRGGGGGGGGLVSNMAYPLHNAILTAFDCFLFWCEVYTFKNQRQGIMIQ